MSSTVTYSLTLARARLNTRGLGVAVELLLLLALSLAYGGARMTAPASALPLPSGTVAWLSLLGTGIGMWLLAWTLDLSPLARLWAAALLMFSGKLAVLIQVGWLPLVAAFPSLAFFFAFLLLSIRRRSTIAAVCAGIWLAFPLFVGADYYTVYLLVGALLAGLLLGFQVDFQTWKIKADGLSLRLLALAAALAGVLALLHTILPLTFLPQFAAADAAPSATCAQPPNWVLLNILLKESSFYDLQMASKTGPSAQFYAYLGLGPLLALVLVPPAFQVGGRRIILLFALLLLASLWLADGCDPVTGRLASSIQGARGFDCPIYALGVTTVAVVTLSALGIQHLLDRLARWELGLSIEIASGESGGQLWLPARWLALAGLFLLLLTFIFELYSAHLNWPS